MSGSYPCAAPLARSDDQGTSYVIVVPKAAINLADLRRYEKEIEQFRLKMRDLLGSDVVLLVAYVNRKGFEERLAKI